MKINIPLYFRLHKNVGNGQFPDLFPFFFDFNEELELPIQRGDGGLRRIVSQIYENGDMMAGSMIEGDLVGMTHANHSLDFIKKSFDGLEGKRVLEIGCGSGYIVGKIAEDGAQCTGLEPGTKAIGFNKPNVRVINDYFPSPGLEGCFFDLIVNFNVLEHIENPLKMLLQIRKHLLPGGKLIFGVPNCETFLKHGDISIFLHEHFNYFTRANLETLLCRSGFEVIRSELGPNEAMIFVFAQASEASRDRKIETKFSMIDFERRHEFLKKSLRAKLLHYAPHDVAVYCPNRALNILSLLNFDSFRVVDDTPVFHNLFFPYLKMPVENFDDIKRNPPQILIIFSTTYGSQIFAKCQTAESLKNTEISIISDFYESDGSL